MDAFKLLTRSTKLKMGLPASKSSISTPLPSAGEAENPQLFPIHLSRATEEQGVDDGEGKKRKRSEEEYAIFMGDEPNLDFFQSGSSNPRPPQASRSLKDVRKESKKTSGGEGPGDTVAQECVLTEAERKAILKSHKIKITDMRTQKTEAEAKLTRSKKKTRKQESVSAVSCKRRKEAQRLYPEPLISFQELRTKYQISRRLVENVFHQGYTVPTEVQIGSLPLLLGACPGSARQKENDNPKDLQHDTGLDLLVVAPTGSGKTLAFMVPLINKIIWHHHKHPQFRGLLSIVMAPTKELVAQIVNEGRKLTLGTGVKISEMRKGMQIAAYNGESYASLSERRDASEDGDEQETLKGQMQGNIPITKSDIIVSTPLLLLNSLSGNKGEGAYPLPSVQNLILDEADVLLDPLFRDQTLAVWSACTNPRLSVGLWSATMGSSVEELAKSTISERQRSLGLHRESFLIRLVVGLKDSAIPNISHKLVYAATEQGKLLGLRQLLHPAGLNADPHAHLRPPFLVFTQTIPRAIALHSELMYDIPIEAGGSSRIAVLHSGLSDTQRSDVMAGFRKGEIWVLITTDLLARGVDFRGINGVVNYDIPNSSAAYVHRVGRTARAGRQGGVAVTFYTKEDIPYVKSIANVIAASEKLAGTCGDRGVQKWLIDALPNLTKKDRKDLKMHGVEARRTVGKGNKSRNDYRKTRISTKSGFERRIENNRRAAIKASQRRKLDAQFAATTAAVTSDDDSWNGIQD